MTFQTNQLRKNSCCPTLAPLPRIASLLFVILLSLNIFGCAVAPTRVAPILPNEQESAVIPGIPGARYWGDKKPPGFEKWLQLSDKELQKSYSAIYGVEHNYLAISGGGPDGAYGAGLLVGWSAHGTRPEFTVVTGISTGALIAPFAFLGEKYDHVLRRVYTELSTADIVQRRGILDIIRNDALASTRPLRKLIEKYIDDSLIEELAIEHRKGRSLLIGTTNLDAARPVTWSITRIAASNAPGAHDLIRDVILASASIPGVFPPVMIEVEVNGRRYQEMHVDGGVTSQVFLYPAGLHWKEVTAKLKVPEKPKLFLIRNSRATADFKSVERRILPIMIRSLSSLIRTQSIGDMATIYFLTSRDGVDFNLAYVPDDFREESQETFDRNYMKKLYELAYDKARLGYPWISVAQP